MLPLALHLLLHAQPSLIAGDPALTRGERELAAWAEHRQATAATPWPEAAWEAMGPKNCGGRIEAVDSPVGEPGTIYAGVGTGGVFKSVDGGLSWEHVFAHEATCSIGDVTVDPSAPETVWVGTGEAHLGGVSWDGVGVYRSRDGGATWEHRGLADSARIGTVLVDPRDSDLVHAAVIGPRTGAYRGRGVHVTRDGGETWEQTLAAGEHVGIVDLVRDPHEPNRLWASGWDRRRGGEGGVFRSLDNGLTWERLEGGLLVGREVGRVALAAAASAPGVVYALIVDHSPPGEGRYDVGGALFRSDDAGDTWRRTSAEYVDTYVGWDFCDVRVAPDDADTVFVCGLRLMVSRDGGQTFARGGEDVFRLLEHPGEGMHLDMHELWIDPASPERILLGTDGGLYLSMDRARTWLHLNNLPIAEFYTVLVDGADEPRVWGGTQDNASLSAPLGAGLDRLRSDAWEYVYLDPWDGGDGFATFPDPSGDGTVYYEHQNGDMRRKAPGAPLRWGRGSGRRITPRAAEGEAPLRFAWNTPLMASAHEAGVLLCAGQRVLRSKDRGDSWEAISPDLAQRGSITTLCESPLEAGRLAAGWGRGELRLTADGGATWSAAGDGLPRAGVEKVALSPHDPERVLICLSDGQGTAHVLCSDDFGATWRALGEGLPSSAVHVVREHPTRDGVLFVGTDLGVWASVDGGATWGSLSLGLPTAPVMDLAIHAPTDTLVAVTHGLSAFRASVSSVAP